MAALCVSTAAPAFAQVAPAPSSASAVDPTSGVEVIVVTAERREENLQDTPVTISAFSAKSLETRGISNLNDLTRYAPNVEISPTKRPAGGSTAISAFIRGVGTGDFQIPTDPAVGVYVDGVYIARTVGGLMSVADIERIEILKGPQGTLFGRNTLGGAINVITTQPSLDAGAHGKLTFRVGDYGRRDVVGSVNGALVDGVVGAKVSLASFNFNGWQVNPTTHERYGKEGRVIGRASVLAQVSSNLTTQLTGDYTYQRQNGINGQLIRQVNTFPNPSRFNEFAAPVLNPGLGLPPGSGLGNQWATASNRVTYETAPNSDNADIWGLSLINVLEVSPALRVKTITAYRDLQSFIQVAGDGTPYPTNQASSTNDSRQFSQELELSGSLGDHRLEYVLGAFYFREKAESTRFGLSHHGVYEVTGNPAHAQDQNQFYTMDAESYAAFGQVTFNVNDSLALVAGARINRDKKTYTAMIIKPELPPPADIFIPLQTASDAWTSFTPRLGINYKVNEDLFLYASYSKGFKSGGFGTPDTVRGIPAYDPEFLTTYEAGLKSTLFNRKLTFNLAGFYSDYKGVQITVLLPPDSFRTTENGGDAEIYGFDLDVQAVPVDGLRLNASVGYNHARFTSVTPEAVAASLRSGLDHRPGTPLPYVPDWSASAGAQYDVDMPGFGIFTPRVDWTYKSRTVLLLADSSQAQGKYSLWGAKLSFVPEANEKLEFSVSVTNLTNKTYYYYRNFSSSSGNELGSAGDPRLITGQVRYNF
ncbi:MAG TPA: TonB-dependent receptor [Sphingomonadaceae bacterium]|nr:TonB-dependent receptor [Sphingomonadaceae bacterium]